jgi:UDP-N-acetylmuramyl pentapeptide phosphotransferase/UDP-N-acetylglucosamine-1-phosphate transferase
MTTLAIACVSLALTCAAIPLVRYIAVRQGLLDRPDGTLKSQIRATPYGGGLAVAIGTSTSLLVLGVAPPAVSVVGGMASWMMRSACDLCGD